MERTLGIRRDIYPIDDILSPPVVPIGGPRERASPAPQPPKGGDVSLIADGEQPCLFGFEVAVAELVAGIIIQIRERRHSEGTVSIHIDRTGFFKLITDVRSAAQMMPELRVVRAVNAD